MARLSDLVRQQPVQPSGTNDGASQPSAAAGHTGSDSSDRWFSSARPELDRIREAVRTNGSLRIDVCREMAGALVRELQQSDACVGRALLGTTKDYVLDNALHVAVIAVKIGMGLNYGDEDLERVALAGLLHDVGMWTLTDSLTSQAGAFTDDQWAAVRSHPERGRRVLAELGSHYEWLATIASQEHERWDGSGYPCRLKGSQIAEPAQIIGLADVFDALVTARPYKKNIPPHHALRELLIHGKPLFAHRLLKALGDHVTLYPVGTPVRLSTGEIGTVSRINPRYPLRPILMIRREEGIAGGGPSGELDLGHAATVHIVEVLQPMSVS